MIGSIRHKGLRRLFEAGDGKLLRADMVPRLRRMLSAIHAAEELAELESVSGWRLVFKWNRGAATDIDLVDYH